jgi:hypothetical protein
MQASRLARGAPRTNRLRTKSPVVAGAWGLLPETGEAERAPDRPGLIDQRVRMHRRREV